MASMLDKDKKKMQERHEKILVAMTKEPANALCADCGQPVKSISLDVWTAEQIEAIQAKGNAKVNAQYNPNAELHPPPSGDREMEQYIRNKYERRLFMTQSSREDRSESSSSRPPTGSSRAAIGISDTSMSKLRSMGFTDDTRNAQALRRSHGNLERAIDILVSEAPLSQPVSRTSSRTGASTPAPPAPKADPMIDLLGLDDGFSAASPAASAGVNTNLVSGTPKSPLSATPSGGSSIRTQTTTQLSGLFPPPPGMSSGLGSMSKAPVAAPAAPAQDTDASGFSDFGQFTDSSFFNQTAPAPAAPANSQPPTSGRFDKNSILSLYSSGNTQRTMQPMASQLSNSMAGMSLAGGHGGVNPTTSWMQQPTSPAHPPQTSSSTPASSFGFQQFAGFQSASANTPLSSSRSPVSSGTQPQQASGGSLMDFGDSFSAFSSAPTTKNTAASSAKSPGLKSNKDLFGEFSDLLR
ncbi:Gtpase activating protein [Dimargaris cristalligena]|nr:Gtpase activating protein [Dimargaris cristalligena]